MPKTERPPKVIAEMERMADGIGVRYHVLRLEAFGFPGPSAERPCDACKPRSAEAKTGAP